MSNTVTDRPGSSTLAVHAGETRPKPYGAIATPIVQTSTYSFEDTAALVAHMQRKEQGLPLLRGEYGRYGNPMPSSWKTSWPRWKAAKLPASLAGHGRHVLSLLAFLEAGDHYILTDDCYRRTRQFGLEFMPR